MARVLAFAAILESILTVSTVGRPRPVEPSIPLDFRRTADERGHNFVIRWSSDVLFDDDKRRSSLFFNVREFGETATCQQAWGYFVECYKRVGVSKTRVRSKQRAEFEKALVDKFESIQISLSHVDVRKAECRNKDHQEAILRELKDGVGYVECNQLVMKLLRRALVAAGKPGLIVAQMVKQGAIVIDVGINRVADGKIVGDVDFDSVVEVAGFLTPVPGGVGPVTVAMLLRNTLRAAGAAV